MNKVVFVGRVVRDVEVRQVGSNGRVVNNVIAIQRHHRDSNGNRATDFIPFVAWDHLAELMDRYCKKGDQISLAGRMQSRKYKNREEQDVYVIECLVEELTLIGSNSTSNTNESAQAVPPAPREEEKVGVISSDTPLTVGQPK